MNYLLVSEKSVWTPAGNWEFRLEKWASDEILEFSNNGSSSNGNSPWSVPPYYRLLKVDGTELMNTKDWKDLAGFLRVVLGESAVPEDFVV